MPGELVLQRVTVEGDELDVNPEHRLISLRRGCEVFGLVLAGQIKKLRGKPWARVAEKYTRDSAGRVQKAILIDVDTFHGWLLSTEPRKVKAEHRAKLEAYQKNALRVLTAYFSGQPLPSESPQEGPWRDRLIRSLCDHKRELHLAFRGGFTCVSAIATELLCIEQSLHAHLLPTGSDDLPDGSVGSRWRRHCLSNRITGFCGLVPLYMPSRGFSVNVRVYPGELLQDYRLWFDEVYVPQHLPDYFARKREFRAAGRLVAASAADHACRSLTGSPAEIPEWARNQLTAAGGIVRAGDPCAIPSPKRKGLSTAPKQGALF